MTNLLQFALITNFLVELQHNWILHDQRFQLHHVVTQSGRHQQRLVQLGQMLKGNEYTEPNINQDVRAAISQIDTKSKFKTLKCEYLKQDTDIFIVTETQDQIGLIHCKHAQRVTQKVRN
jgi:hypothetical protein